MIGRNTRGIRRASTRVRLAVAAAVLVGGGAAGVVAVAANHNGAVNAASAGYNYSHSTLSESHAMSAAMNSWNKSPQSSLSLISRMTPMRTFSMTSFHTHMLALQRGTVVGAVKNEFVIKSSNHQLELWFVNHGTRFLNVGSSSMGMTAMTGGNMMAMPNHMAMNKGAKVLTRGDLVFIFGEKVHGKLTAQLVLFVAPMKVTATPTATPSMTATATPTATSTATATPTATSTTPTPTTTITTGGTATPVVMGTKS